jgi:hypothetical protein
MEGGQMADSAEGAGRGLRALLWSARITGGVFVAVLVFVIVVNFVHPAGEAMPTGKEWLGLAMFPFGVFVAYALAFRWGLVGGVLAIVCLFGWWAYVSFMPRILPIAVMVAIPGILYVTHGLLSRREEQAARPADEAL